jgi:hypothetical protein
MIYMKWFEKGAKARLGVILFFVLLSGSMPAQESWKLKSNKDGIQLYTQTLDDSPIKPIRTVCTLQTTLTRVAAVLLDVNRTPEWVYGTKACSLLRQESPTVIYYYAEMGLPWPASNRDFIIRISLSQNEQTKAVVVRAENLPTYLPEKKGIVRIQKSSGEWLVTPLPGGLVRVQYTLQVDPGGSLPSGLVNMFAGDGPVESFKNLRNQVRKPQYDHVSFPFVKD